MLSIKHSALYNEVLKELNYKFADVFIFDGFIVSEVKEGISFSWDDHAQRIVNDITDYTNCKGCDLVYISHRINSYSVIPTDWLKFFRSSFDLKGYGIIGYTGVSFVSTVIENLFFNKKIKRFETIEEAAEWAICVDCVELNS